MARPKAQSRPSKKCTFSSAQSQQLAWVCADAVVAALLLPHKEVVCEAGIEAGKQLNVGSACVHRQQPALHQ